MKEAMTLGKFLQEYSTNDACLERLKDILYPNGITCIRCKKVRNFTKKKDRPVYQCFCGYQVSPLAGTIFHKSSTPLQYWFYAIFVMKTTRSGISAKALQRELGVTYKCAFRMFHQIRKLMAQAEGTILDGEVEVDETFLIKRKKHQQFSWDKPDQKESLMGMVTRGGKAFVKHVPDTYNHTLLPAIKKHIDPKARVITDQLAAYRYLTKMGYLHDSVNHMETYVVKGTDIHTQNIEGLWSGIKRGIYGVYRHVSKKYLQAYVDEYIFRFNNRKSGDMFDLLLQQVAFVKTN